MKTVNIKSLNQLELFFKRVGVKVHNLNVLGYTFENVGISKSYTSSNEKNIFIVKKKITLVLTFNIKTQKITTIHFIKANTDKSILITHNNNNFYDYVGIDNSSKTVNLSKSFKTIFRNLLKEMF